jgi:transcriptional regulator of acetoin/glycerol metabolism
MCDEHEKVRCVQCELVQWANRPKCRRCGNMLPRPIVNIVERVVEKVIIRQNVECPRNLKDACHLISATTERLAQSHGNQTRPMPEIEGFPTLEAMQRVMILAAYEQCNRKPLEAARLLGIGKTTVYRKLKEIGKAAA